VLGVERAAQVAGAEASELGGVKPAVAEYPQQGVVAFAGQRAAVRDVQKVRLVGVGGARLCSLGR
jgi:hypothetical protein